LPLIALPGSHKLQQRHSTISGFSDNLLLLSSLKWLFIIARKQVEDLQNSLISFDERSFAMSRPV
jgi:hypothetical protein